MRAARDIAPTNGSNRSRHAFVVWLVVFIIAAPVTPSGRSAVPSELVSLALAVITRVFPGAQVDHVNNAVVWPDGRRERFEFSRADVVNDGGELLLVTGLEFPDRREAVEAKLGTGVHVPDRSATCRIVMLRATGAVPGSTPTVAAYREALPDVASPLTTCHEIYLDRTGGGAPPAPGPRWPRVMVAYGSVHHRTGGAIGITWKAVLDGETLTWLSRIPVTITRVGQDTWEDIAARQNGPDDVVFTGESTGRSFRVRCQLTTCRVPPDVVWQILP